MKVLHACTEALPSLQQPGFNSGLRSFAECLDSISSELRRHLTVMAAGGHYLHNPVYINQSKIKTITDKTFTL